MNSYFGAMEIVSVNNENCSAEYHLTDAHVKYVQYPDCQQLIIWLPQPGRAYNKIFLIEKTSGKVSKQWEISELLNGSIQLLWDTLTWSPGKYTLEIRSANGTRHTVHLIKHKETEYTEKKPRTTPIEEKKAPIQYRDGFAKIIPDDDLILRKKLADDLARKFGCYLEYTGNLRAGSVIYHNGAIRIEFYHEMGGGDCMLYIDIPAEKEWEGRTGTSLEERKDIVEFVAKTVQAEQASNCNYTIGNDTITFNYK